MFFSTEMTRSNPKAHTIMMVHKGFRAVLRQTKKLNDIGRPHGLPPGTPVPVYPVEALPGCPDTWVREAGSYVCPVSTDWGLWFDWTANDEINTAVVSSVKGMNPITGQKMEDINLHRYVEKCPVHNCDFVGDRLCPKCEYKWPPQNYVSSPKTLWWDGFRQPDGTVRQFFFSEDEKRDIASLVIGKENTVPAFGFVFYEPKERRIGPDVYRGSAGPTGHTGPAGSIGHTGHIGPIGPFDKYTYPAIKTAFPKITWEGSSSSSSLSGPEPICAEPHDDFDIDDDLDDDGSPCYAFASSDIVKTSGVMGFAPEPSDFAPRTMVRSMSMAPPKSVSVGAGAEIRQNLIEDNHALTEWKEKPSAMIRLYFVFKEQFEQIVDKGVKDLSGSKEGYLKDLPVG
jgi:hypothetical protein